MLGLISSCNTGKAGYDVAVHSLWPGAHHFALDILLHADHVDLTESLRSAKSVLSCMSAPAEALNWRNQKRPDHET